MVRTQRTGFFYRTELTRLDTGESRSVGRYMTRVIARAGHTSAVATVAQGGLG